MGMVATSVALKSTWTFSSPEKYLSLYLSASDQRRQTGSGVQMSEESGEAAPKWLSGEEMEVEVYRRLASEPRWGCDFWFFHWLVGLTPPLLLPSPRSLCWAGFYSCCAGFLCLVKTSETSWWLHPHPGMDDITAYLCPVVPSAPWELRLVSKMDFFLAWCHSSCWVSVVRREPNWAFVEASQACSSFLFSLVSLNLRKLWTLIN